MSDAPPYVAQDFTVRGEPWQTTSAAGVHSLKLYMWSDGLVTTTTDRPEGTRP